jgi:hypothetical protein
MTPRQTGWLPALLILLACTDDSPETPQEENIIRIPVVVHVIYADDEFNISDKKIHSQLEVLNNDFRRRNKDQDKIPDEFKHLATDTEIEFELASIDPEGNSSSGITRTYSTVQGWDGHDPENKIPVEDLELYFTSKGGRDAWPTDRYLNIWVVEMSNHSGRLGIAGYAHFPGADARVDGVVIDPRVFGTVGELEDGHLLGRTATHEIGHWLNLIHTFAGRTCESTDFVDDTPSSEVSYHGHPAYPQFSCGHSSMFMNFMDYVDDDAMYMFTHGQKQRMRAVFLPGGLRHSLYQNAMAQGKKRLPGELKEGNQKIRPSPFA